MVFQAGTGSSSITVLTGVSHVRPTVFFSKDFGQLVEHSDVVFFVDLVWHWWITGHMGCTFNHFFGVVGPSCRRIGLRLNIITDDACQRDFCGTQAVAEVVIEYIKHSGPVLEDLVAQFWRFGVLMFPFGLVEWQ